MPNTNRSLRFAVDCGARAARLYSASDIQVIKTSNIGDIPYLSRLGPDVLNEPIAVADLERQFADPRFQGRALGGLLLDQGFVAGIGNYLRSEILFVAGLHPSTKLGTLSSRQKASLAQAVLDLVQQAYRHKGVTNDLTRAAALRAQGLTFEQRRHHVFTRSGLPCYVCGTKIEKTVVASRRLYVCPRCQPA